MTATGAVDEVGDVLRAFYQRYGMPDEGPPAGMNLTAVMGENFIPQHELQLLRRALDDTRLQRQFDQCRRIVEDLAGELTREEFLREVSATNWNSVDHFDQLSNGVFWFSLASSLDRRANGDPILPAALEGLELPLPIRVRLTVVGSLVLRLYIALVYMREGALAAIIDEGARLQKPCCGKVKKLLNCDYLRHIRNALSHGSFSPSVIGLVFADSDRAVLATPGFLNWLSTWINLIQLQALAAMSGPDGGAPTVH
ncbi:MAG: hypothetical protein WAL85_03400 [Candidatus Korobacteraceae bacterium]